MRPRRTLSGWVARGLESLLINVREAGQIEVFYVLFLEMEDFTHIF